MDDHADLIARLEGAVGPDRESGEAVAWRGVDIDGNESVTLRHETMLDWVRYGRAITPLYASPAPKVGREEIARVIAKKLDLRRTDPDLAAATDAVLVLIHGAPNDPSD